MHKDQHVSVNQPSDSEPGLRVRAVDASDVTAIADFQTTWWREAYRGVVSQAYLDLVDVADRECRWSERLASGTRRIVLAEVFRHRAVGAALRTPLSYPHAGRTTEFGQWCDLIVVRAEVAPRGVCTRKVDCPRRRR